MFDQPFHMCSSLNQVRQT